MKVKWDFVTNSSSTAYLVGIPKDLDVTDVHDQIGESMEYQDELGEYAEDDKDEFFKLFSKNILTLKAGDHICNNDDPCY